MHLRTLAVTGLAVVAAGCGGGVDGTPPPAPSRDFADVFGKLDACEVLELLTVGKGFSRGPVSQREACGLQNSQFATYGLALDITQGLAEFESASADVVRTPINGRDSVQADAPTGGCAIALEVDDHARAVVTVRMASEADDDQACQNAQILAARVEPFLRD